MPLSAESSAPERGTSTETVSDFIHITDELRRETPELFDDVTAVMHLGAELKRSGLPEDRLKYLEDERRVLVEQFLEHPEEALLAEVDILARSYRDRSIVGVDYEGVTSTQFVTRDPERMKADLHFRLTDFPGGHSRIRIEVPLLDSMYEAPEPFFLVLDSVDGLTIEQRSYERGQYRYKALEPDSELGKERLWRFFTHSFTATDLLDNRSPEEHQRANQQARAMLRDKIIHG